MCNALHRDRLPDRRIVIRFDFTGRRPRESYWLLIERRETEICREYPGLDEDLFVAAEAEAFVRWHAGQLTWAEATHDRRIQTSRPDVARSGLPHLERTQFLRQHQAGLTDCDDPGRLSASRTHEVRSGL
jgi:hypothetical protein